MSDNSTISSLCKEAFIHDDHVIISDITDCEGDNVNRDEKQGFSDRFNAILDKAGFPPKGKGRQKALAEKFNVTQRGARNWTEAEAIPNISTMLPRIIDAFRDQGASMEWLLMGNPDFDPERPRNRRVFDGIDGNIINLATRKITVVGSLLIKDNENWFQINVNDKGGFILFPTDNSKAYAVLCSGDGMSPRIKNGEFIIVDKCAQVHPGDDVLIISNDGTFKIKQFLYERDGIFYLMSINTSKAISINAADIKEIHPISGVANKKLFTKT